MWRIRLSGGAFVGKETTGIEHIPVAEQISMYSNFIFGFGITRVIVSVEYDEGVTNKREQTGFVFLFFIKINPGG